MFMKGSIVCRLCLFSDLNTALFEEIDDNDIQQTPLALKINSALKWKVLRDDNLPNHVCNECVQKLDFLVWCDTWSHRIQMCFTKVLTLLHHCQRDEAAEETLLSIFKERNAQKMPQDQAMMLSKLRALMLELETIFFECAILKADSNSSEHSSGTGNLFQCYQKEKSLFQEKFVQKCIQEKAAGISLNFSAGKMKQPCIALAGFSGEGDMKLGVVDRNIEPHQALSVLINSDSDATEANINVRKDDSSCGSETRSNLLQVDINSEASSNKQFVCPECKERFLRKIHLFRHLMGHEGAAEKYQCSVCRRKFISTCELNRHTRAHMGLKPYKCAKCNRFFSQKNLLDNHMNWHEGRKSHLCDICGKYLSSGPNLKSHILNLHCLDKKKPFKCKECGKCFTRNHHLENHASTHEKSRPHQCATCGVTFKRSSQLREHELVHSGEKRYTCSECNKAFRTKRVLNVHKLLHSELKPHQCTFCTKSFVRRGGLSAHLKTHSNQ